MRTEEVRGLLEEAASGVAEPDLVDLAWSRGSAIRRRGRRRAALTGLAVAGLVVSATVLAGPPGGRGGERVNPSPTVTTTRSVSLTGTIAGTPYWLAPEPGAEPYLDWFHTALGHRIALPPYPLEDLRDKPVIKVAAVLLRKLPGKDRYRPVVLSTYERWAEARQLELVPTRDGDGDPAPPLDATAVARDGERIAFPQPNEVVVLDASTGESQRIPVPSATLENVAWLPSGDRLLAGGDGAAFLVTPGAAGSGEPVVTPITPGSDPWSLGTPFTLDLEGDLEGSSIPVVARHDGQGRRHVERRLTLPVSQWYGSSFTAGTLVARAFFASRIPELASRTVSTRPQMIAVIDAQPGARGRLLVLDDAVNSTQRFRGCCSVLGWYDARTVLLESRSGVDKWILGWDVRTGELRRVAELEADVVAVGPMLR